MSGCRYSETGLCRASPPNVPAPFPATARRSPCRRDRARGCRSSATLPRFAVCGRGPREGGPGSAGGGRLGQLVELVELGLKQFLVRKPGLVFGDQRGGQRTAEGVFDHLAVFGGAEEYPD